MRPANQQQALQHMRHLLTGKLKGNRQTRVKEHTRRAEQIAATIWQRFQVGPYQYQLKHIRWYLEIQTQNLKPPARYRHWLTVENILQALNKGADWPGQLQGNWMHPGSLKRRK